MARRTRLRWRLRTWPLDDRPAPVATAILDYWATDRMVLMDLGLVPLFRGPLGGVLQAVLRLRDRNADAAACAWIIGGMHANGAPGTLKLNRRGRMVHR